MLEKIFLMNFTKFRQLAVLAVFGGYFGSFLPGPSLLFLVFGGLSYPTLVQRIPHMPFAVHFKIALKKLRTTVLGSQMQIRSKLQIKTRLELKYFQWEIMGNQARGRVNKMNPNIIEIIRILHYQNTKYFTIH